MLILYNAGIRLYFFGIYLASFFNKKARLWLYGRKNQRVSKNGPSIWFHFASLGEFEQGRPVLEQMRALHPSKKIIVTFFSPSGFEIRKNTPLADFVYYLPLDTPKNAREFIDATQPDMAIFTKYEYWYHYFNELHSRHISLYIISGIFRPDQIFFKWYGGLHRKMLRFVTRFFVQDERSEKLLQQIGINNITISGDTRFDRVWANAQHPKSLPLISAFKNGHKVFIAGSTWPPDEELLPPLMAAYPDWKFIIAPHEIGEEKIASIMKIAPTGSAIRFSQIDDHNLALSKCRALVIDNIGMLSSLYQYGDIAYIGGGFGVGIHNTLEAAAFGLPVIFGPNYEKFKEAKDIIALKAGFTVNSQVELNQVVEQLITDSDFYTAAAASIRHYVEEQQGATATIISHINQ